MSFVVVKKRKPQKLMALIGDREVVAYARHLENRLRRLEPGQEPGRNFRLPKDLR